MKFIKNEINEIKRVRDKVRKFTVDDEYDLETLARQNRWLDAYPKICLEIENKMVNFLLKKLSFTIKVLEEKFELSAQKFGEYQGAKQKCDEIKTKIVRCDAKLSGTNSFLSVAGALILKEKREQENMLKKCQLETQMQKEILWKDCGYQILLDLSRIKKLSDVENWVNNYRSQFPQEHLFEAAIEEFLKTLSPQDQQYCAELIKPLPDTEIKQTPETLEALRKLNFTVLHNKFKPKVDVSFEPTQSP